jgi:hypothetical protein
MRRLLATALVALLISPVVIASDVTIVGAWVINRDLSPMTGGSQEGEHRGSGGGGGRGGFMGGRGGSGGGNGPSDAELHKREAIRERLTTVPDRLIITRTSSTVTIVDGFGRTATLKTDGKKQPRLTGEGEFTSKAHFEGEKLLIEDDFGGPKVFTTFEPTLERGELARLIVTITLEAPQAGGRGGPEGHGGSGGHGGAGGHGGSAGRGGPEGEHRPGQEARHVYDAEAK